MDVYGLSRDQLEQESPNCTVVTTQAVESKYYLLNARVSAPTVMGTRNHVWVTQLVGRRENRTSPIVMQVKPHSQANAILRPTHIKTTAPKSSKNWIFQRRTPILQSLQKPYALLARSYTNTRIRSQAALSLSVP